MTLLREVVETFIRLVKAEIVPNAVLAPRTTCSRCPRFRVLCFKAPLRS